MLLIVCKLFSLMPSVIVSAAEVASIVGLKDAFSKHLRIGTALSASEASKAHSQELTPAHYNSVTCENEMKPDTMLESCEENNIPMRCHVFLWYSQTPDWFFRENFSSSSNYIDIATVATMVQHMECYFRNLFALIETEFPHLDFYAWDIVNKAFTDSNPSVMRPANQSNWLRIYGDDSFIYKAFRFVREYAPKGCKLYYKDYNENNAGMAKACIWSPPPTFSNPTK